MRRNPIAAATVEDLRRAYYDNASTAPGSWISEVQLDPPQLIVSDEGTGQTYRVPVTIASNGTFAFGAPVAVRVQYVDTPAGRSAAASFRRVSAADQRRVSAAVARGAIRPERADEWRARAARGEDISIVDRMAGVAPEAPALAAARGRGQQQSEEDMLYETFFGPLKQPAEDHALDPFRHLFPPSSHQEVIARGAAADRAAAQAAQQGPASGDDLYEALWPEEIR